MNDYSSPASRTFTNIKLLLPLLASACLTFLVIAVYVLSDTSRGSAGTYDLRGYGKLEVTERQEMEIPVIRITAANADAAKLVYSKFLSDFTTLPTVEAQKQTVGATVVKLLVFDSGRRLLPVWREGDAFVDIYAFDSEKQTGEFFAGNSDAIKGAVMLKKRAHPLFMDLWDRRNMGFWYSLGFKGITKTRTDDQDFDFMRPLLLNVNTVGNGVSAVMMRCDRDDLGFKTNVWFDCSNYAFDADPGAITKSDPDVTHMSSYYGDVPISDNPIRQAQMAAMLAYQGQFTGDDHLMSITDPHGEVTSHTEGGYYGAAGRDEYSRRDFVHYLREVRKLSLPELGERWYGDASHFTSWDDVPFPRERDFYGWKDGASQSLSGTWRWRNVPREEGVAQQFFSPSYDDSAWYAYQQPGTEYLAGPNQGGGWMRYSFTPDRALLKSGKPIFLTICPFNNAPYKNPSTVYLNGKKIANLSFGHGQEWGQMDVSSLLKPADNVLAVYTMHGNICGPVFLTTEKAEVGFPTHNAHLNARRFDIGEWVADSGARGVAIAAKRMRGIDPVRGIKLMAPHDNMDIIFPYMETWGIYPHCTGEGAFFRPWAPRLARLHGIMASSEPSQSVKDVKGLKRLFFTLTMEGTSVLDYFYNLHDILIHPEKEQWYVNHLSYARLNGRFQLKQPEVAIAASWRSERYGVQNASPYQNDPGRGDIQQAHYGYMYVTERDVMEGRLGDFKVILDDNFTTLEPGEVDALEDWVKQGGILVLNQRSGRNSILEPETWPIRKLTGCEPEIRPQEGTITFEKSPSLLKAYAGKSFKNYGEALDWQQHNYFTDSIALEPKAEGVEVLARYEDGKPAMVVRTLGTGKVVVLGSAFYRKSTDIKGFWVGSSGQTAFYKALLSDLGLRPLVESDQETLWAERFIANNGSTELLVLGNQDDEKTLNHAGAVWDLGFAPRRVFDPTTGEDLPVAIDGNKVNIGPLTLSPYEMRMFAVERTQVSLADTVIHWLERQSDMWRALPPAESPAKLPSYWPHFFYGDYQVMQTDSETDARSAMRPDSTMSNGWKTMPAGDWASAGLKQGPGLWAVYRKAFQLDSAWLNDLRGTELVRSSASRSLWKHIREMTINGVPICVNGKFESPETILTTLKPGENQLAVLTSSGVDGNGGFYGDFGLRRIPGASGDIMELDTEWIAYPTEIDPQSVDLPQSGTWLWAKKQVVVPEKYKNCEVWIEIEGNASSVSTNGQLRYTTVSYGSMIQPKPLLVNITPDIRFGEKNDLVVLGKQFRITMGNVKASSMDLRSVRLIFVPRK